VSRLPGAGGRETEALQGLLAAEHAAAWGWEVAGAELDGIARALAREAVAAHRARRDRLSALLRDRGAEPAPASAAYALPEQTDDPVAALRLGLLLEEGTGAAQARALALLEAPALRAAVVSALAGAAVRAARVRALLDPDGPLTVPFPGAAGLPQPLPAPATPSPVPPAAGSPGSSGSG
jgi:hypothetical protein